MSSGNWSPEENIAIVADYLKMLALELRGDRFNKRSHNRELQEILRDRSPGAIEFKHANISAVMSELGYPYIDGYKPRRNYQDDLRAEIIVQLAESVELAALTHQVVEAPFENRPPLGALTDILVRAPESDNRSGRAYERAPDRRRQGVDYLALEARNTSLGAAGEQFALEFEHRRLWEAGRRDLADRIEHVSRTRGDGLGYDIHSFDTNGQDRMVEVKTTGFGALTPFYASQREVTLSTEQSDVYVLLRLFHFRTDPKLFLLPGSLQDTCRLEATQFRASLA